jgi:hypothetical protein
VIGKRLNNFTFPTTEAPDRGGDFSAKLDYGVPFNAINTNKRTGQEKGFYFSLNYNRSSLGSKNISGTRTEFTMNEVPVIEVFFSIDELPFV